MENKRKKVLFAITKGNFGGAQKYVFDLATNLPEKKFEVVVACGTKEGDALVEKLKEKNIRTIFIGGSEREISLKSDTRSLVNFVKILKEEKPDILHLNSSKIGLLGSIAAFYVEVASRLKIKTIFTSHGWAFNEQSRSSFSKIIFYIGHYFTIVFSDVTLAVSEKTKDDIAWLPFIAPKIKVIYNGIENFDFYPREEARVLLSKNSEEKTIIFSIAELHNNKGIDVALQAISTLKENVKNNIVYSIAGSGEEKENLQRLSGELGLDDVVVWLGYVDGAKKLLSGADIFLLPSRTENLPFAVLEAGTASLPIVATSAGGVPEIIEDMKSGILVHKNNAKEIAEAINYILENKEKSTKFGKNISKIVSQKFSLKRMLVETIEHYSTT